MGRISLEKKLIILEEFLSTGAELQTKTIYIGYPVGKWGVHIRNSLKKRQNGDKNSINPTEEQIEKMKELGILERQKGSTIDEKISEMGDWLKKYPAARLVNVENIKSILKDYSQSESDYNRLYEEYKKMQSHYEYVRARKRKGKLTEEQVIICKESNFGGVLGYSILVEELSQKLELKKSIVSYLIQKYGTIENFYDLYQNKKIYDVNDRALAALKIKRVIDLDAKQNDSGYDMLMENLIINDDDSEIDLIIYSSQKLKELLQELPERDRILLERRYDLNGDCFPNTLENVAREIGLSHEGIRLMEERIQKKLRYKINENCLWRYEDLKAVMTENEKNEHSKLEEIIMNICLNNTTFYDEEVINNFEFLKGVATEYNTRKVFYGKDLSEKENLTEDNLNDTIDELDIPKRVHGVLRKLGYRKVKDIVGFTEEDFSGMQGMGRGSRNQVLEKLKPYRKLFGIQEIEPSQLQLLKEQKRKLREEKKELKRKQKQAQSLLDECNEVLGENKEDQKPNLDD